MAKAVYKPLGLLVSVLGGILASIVFKRVWKLVSGAEDAPNATDEGRSWAQVIPAAALEGAVFGLVKAAVDRAGAAGFARATGTWPS
ncbi:MAG: DUF4235 domain-containing protein [Actinobacteria bacterium]|nr:DUF4235 domain-containing protein [Actinomycetota bacterium]